MKRLVVFSSPRTSDRTLAGLAVIGKLAKNEGGREDTIVVLIQDAVLLATMSNITQPLDEDHDIFAGYVLEEHLIRRGFDPRSLRHPFRSAGYDEIVGLMMQDDVQVLGSF
ncbi:MAG: DsrH/TusB family sulfur metabolism protein [archaeon]|nr:DsrH/TusB family sulfur metabolism protein [archaeon]